MAESPGYIYIAENPSIPQLVKIGKTTRPPEQRLKELSSSTAVPQEYDLVDFFYVPDANTAEKHIHEHLRRLRPNPRREFFEMKSEDAVGFVKAYIDLVQKQEGLTSDGDVPWDDAEWVRQAEKNVERERQRRSWNQDIRNGEGTGVTMDKKQSTARSNTSKPANGGLSRSGALALALVFAVGSFAAAYYWFSQTFFQQSLPGAVASRTLSTRVDRERSAEEMLAMATSARETALAEQNQYALEMAEAALADLEADRLASELLLEEDTITELLTETPEQTEPEELQPELQAAEPVAPDAQVAAELPPEAMQRSEPAVVDETPQPATVEQTTWGVLANAELERAVAASLGFTGTAEELAAEIASIGSLDLSGYGLTDISGLEQFRRVQNLTLDNNAIRDLSPLQALPLLQNLSLNGNGLQNASSLSGLRYLRGLSLRNNQLSDLSFLGSLQTLTRLHLDNNPIRDLRPLADLGRLLAVSASGTGLQSLEGVLNHPSLLEADLRSNGIQSLPQDLLQGRIPRIDLRGNPLQQVDPEVMESLQDNSQIRF